MIYKIIILVMCHLIGDYVLQNDFIASTKGSNRYHMLVHSILYCIPFSVVFGIDIRLLIMFIGHFIIDTSKARYNYINYTQDQIYHYLYLIIYLI
ncbi:DUF3307 domain-containing protein [Terrisporobacter hibernicus]|uniref:DUF3307 domain-containing protein n=2 Tax=Terrisporobacter hibernicus TaxID=2813371 RepID=A0AAX2ZFG8_9FIRM|nr:DUF3307 domain-containing protein [Terrisporobacter hibernicus]